MYFYQFYPSLSFRKINARSSANVLHIVGTWWNYRAKNFSKNDELKVDAIFPLKEATAK